MPVAEYKQLTAAQVRDQLMPELTTLGNLNAAGQAFLPPAIAWCGCSTGC